MEAYKHEHHSVIFTKRRSANEMHMWMGFLPYPFPFGAMGGSTMDGNDPAVNFMEGGKSRQTGGEGGATAGGGVATTEAQVRRTP